MPNAILFSLLLILLPSLYIIRRLQRRPPTGPRPRACKKLGRDPGASLAKWRTNLLKVLWGVWHRHQHKQGPIVGYVRGLYVHPIKSCRAVELDEAAVLQSGLKFDRQFSFAEFNAETPSKPAEWHFIAQRNQKYAGLTNIKVEIWVPDRKSPEFSSKESNVQSAGVLVLRYPDPGRNADEKEAIKAVEIPYDPNEEQIAENGYTLEKMTIWKDRPDALLIASTIAANPPTWITDIQAYLGCSKPLALFRIATGRERLVFRNAPGKDELGYQSVVGFADAYPLHTLGLASVADLDSRLTHVAPRFSDCIALRFRANIYFTGPDAYAEDSWKRIRIGQRIYHVACRTTRCDIPNIDQSTGVRHRTEPMKTMKSYRNIDEGAGPGMACLGMQMVPAAEHGIIKVGDEIQVLETGPHFYIKQ
ncbi:MAG: hypothetical protein Q9181_001448 [Wetmoreana brouardii]